MQEALIQYIWKNSIFNKNELYQSDTGESIVIIDPGIHNRDGGPDFTNTRLEIDGILWAGNVEIHKRASEWYEHGHHTNPSYNNVILHVVIHADRDCYNSAGRKITCIELKYDQIIEKRYQKLIGSMDEIPCTDSLDKLDPSLISFWLSALTVERLQSKITQIQTLLTTTKNNWEEVLYIYIAHSFGLKVNTLPFEMLAKSLPLKIVSNHTRNILQLEALFFGQAGFLEKDPKDEYQRALYAEYQYLKRKYQLHAIENHLWQFLRIRPTNFPTVRLAQFCALINHSGTFFSMIMKCDELKQLTDIFKVYVSEYWKTHYTFGKVSVTNFKFLGKSTIHSIIINAILPFIFIYGRNKNNTHLTEKAIYFLEQLPAENNHITCQWNLHRIQCRNAAESQALIQLTAQYCHHKRCLDCQIGHLILNH